MMKNVMTAGVVSAAIAAAALLTQTANAAPLNAKAATKVKVEQSNKRGQGKKVVTRTTKRTMTHQPTAYAGHRGQPRGISRFERRQAVHKCANAIQRRTDRAFPGPYGQASYKFRPNITQIGPNAIRVNAPVAVSGPRATVTVPSNCVVRRGQIARLRYNAQNAREKVIRKQRYQRQTRHYWGSR